MAVINNLSCNALKAEHILTIKKSTLKSFMLGLSIYGMMIDSGGFFGFRNYVFGFFILFALPYLFKSTDNLRVLLVVSLSIIISLLGIFSNLINDVEISKAYPWIPFLISIYIFYKSFLFFNNEEFVNGFLFGGLLFSISILLVHFLLVTNLFISADDLLVLLNLSFNGFFHHYSVLGFNYYSIYFQSTLTLVVFTIIAYLDQRYKIYIFFLFILAISLSRFGFIVAIFIPSLLYFIRVNKLSKLISAFIIPFAYSIIIFYFLTYFFYYGNFHVDAYSAVSSSDARIAHTISTVNSFNLSNFFIGQGLGSEFYTMRSDSFTNNTELSQLEFLRKFGFISFTFFHLMIFFTVYFNHKKQDFKTNIYIFTFYLASMSNPILTSLLFSMLIGYSLSQISNKNKKVTLCTTIKQ